MFLRPEASSSTMQSEATVRGGGLLDAKLCAVDTEIAMGRNQIIMPLQLQ